MKKICPRMKDYTFLLGILQSFIATILYTIIAIIIFMQTKIPTDFANFINSKAKNLQEQTEN